MSDLGLVIRKFENGDQKQIEDICYDTGFLGNSMASIFSDKELFTKLLLRPYFDYDGDNIFVAEKDNKIVGYTLSATNPKFEFMQNLNTFDVATKMVSRALSEQYNSRSNEYVKWSIFRGSIERANFPKGLPGKHINLLKNYRNQGIGTLLTYTMISNLKEQGCPGFYGLGMETDAKLRYLKRFGVNIYNRKLNTKFKPEFPNTDLYHICIVKYFEGSKNE